MQTPIKVNFLLKNFTEHFYEQLSKKVGMEKYAYLVANGVTPQIGADTMREKLEFNILYKTYQRDSLSPIVSMITRKGYRLLTMYFQ